MSKYILTISLLAFYISAFPQSDEIIISANFAQSIELRVIGNANINFTFSTLDDYKNGKFALFDATGFEVASSISFEVQAEFTPMTSASGDELDIRNLSYHVCFPDEKRNDKGVRWDIPAPDYSVHKGNQVWDGSWTTNPVGVRAIGFFLADEGPKTILVPGPSGNAGSFEDNRFYFQITLGVYIHNDMIGIPRLLDQNIQPGTYTTTMTLTAIPSVS